MTTTRVLVAAAIVAIGAALFLTVHRHGGGAAVLPRVPGVANPRVTQADVHTTICRSGWTKTIRPPVDYTNGLKLEQMRQYGLHGPPSAYQEDHLISLEVGGDPTDPRNLWPEPYPRAAQVDQIENELNAKICSGALTLVQAQDEESTLKHTHG
ncbi:MAG: hypothetical protein JOY72_01390 [Actinobacteria bacterium]|nr:hypothetical protein [Actinomycetota bacterium]MBV8478933.1 hypothetical protein [Actinomycetota bacterium]